MLRLALCCLVATASVSAYVIVLEEGCQAANYNDCHQVNVEHGMKCDSSHNCVHNPGGELCLEGLEWTCPDGSCGENPCRFRIVMDQAVYGDNCVDATEPESCTHCAKYFCADNQWFRAKLADGTCAGPACRQASFRSDVCVP